MAVFNYVAVKENGKTHRGILEGDSVNQIRSLLRAQNLIPIEITLQTLTPTTNWKILNRRKRVSSTQLAIFSYQFALLLAAGLPVEGALDSMATEMEDKALKQVVLGVRAKVLEGHTLASGMNDYPHVFPKLYVASVAVGGKTGQLDQVIKRLAEYYEKQRLMKDKAMQALIYPALLTLISMGVIIFLLTYVIPQIATVFTDTGNKLPGITIFLLSLSGFLKQYGVYILILLVASFTSFRLALRDGNFRYKFHKFLLKIPVINQTLIAINAARFSRTFGILYAAGVPVLDALDSANSIVELLPMQESIQEAIRKVGEGSPIHKALQQTRYFSALSNQLMASGEASGDLETMLEKAATFQEQNTTNKLNTALSLFEPILIVTMGAAVLFIVLAVLLPIFEMGQLVQ